MTKSKTLPYKILIVLTHEYIYSRGYRLYKYVNDSQKDFFLGAIDDKKYYFLSKFKLLRRFFRAEITGLYLLNDGSMLALAKKGIFKRTADSKNFKKCYSIPRGSKPLNLCCLPNGHIFFGEYFMNMEKKSVHVYCSVDNGDTWNVVYTFEEGNINHIHGLFYDKYTDRMWCLTGDRENECIIGYTEDEFKTFVEVFRGGQEYRACQLFFYPDFFVYATDSQYMKNTINKVDRKSLEITKLLDIQGTAIKGGQINNEAYISTTIEPSEVNKDHFAHVWFSRDGLQWNDVYSGEKDLWPAILQFGTFEFPRYVVAVGNQLFVTGRALKKMDGLSCSLPV